MLMVDEYSGITKEYRSEYKQAGSKFYGFVFPIANLEDFTTRIKELRTEYKDSTHVCSAYVLNLDRKTVFCTDDGEPSNSSGRPILNALLSSGMSFVGAAVVRYYGGKKLGIPGLIESYGGAAQICLDKADFKTLVVQSTLVCTIDQAMQYKLFNFLSKRKDLDYQFTDNKFTIRFSKSMTSSLRTELQKIPTLALID